MATIVPGPFSLPKLPYAEDALDPAISAETIAVHYGKHHKGYVAKLNELVADTPFSDMMLEDVIRKTHGALEKKTKTIFNNAAQVWNHTFYWHCLSPTETSPKQPLASQIDRDFGSLTKLKEALTDSAVKHFGSGWAWLVLRDGKLAVIDTSDAETPLATGGTALLTIDVWEHAYYLDRQNQRDAYVKAVLGGLLNWDFASENFERQGAQAT